VTNKGVTLVPTQRQLLILATLCSVGCLRTANVEVTPKGNPAALSARPAAAQVVPAAPIDSEPLAEVQLETWPYFTSGVAKQAKDAFDRGNYGLARELLKDETSRPEVRFLRAVCAFRGGKHKVAGPELVTAAKDYAALADRCFMYAGVSFEKLQDLDQAAQAYAQVPADTTFYSTARFSLARVLQAKGELAPARAALEPLVATSNPKRPEALWTTAVLSAAQHDEIAQKIALLELWSRHPTSPFASRAAALLKPAELSPELALIRAASLFEERRPGEGLALAQSVLRKLTADAAATCRAELIIARAQDRLGQKASSQKTLSRLATGCADADAHAQAQALVAAGQEPELAIATYDSLVRDHPGHPLADDALFAAATLSRRQGDVVGALERYERLSAQYPEGEHAADALFRAFWLHRKAGNFNGALGALERLDALKVSVDRETHLMASYWKARLWEESGNPVLAAELLESVSQAAPATYYGLMARSRLLDLDPARPELPIRVMDAQVGSSERHLAIESLGADRHFRAGVELYRLGLPGALPELLAVDLSTKPHHAKSLLLKVLFDAGKKKEVALLSTQGELGGAVNAETAPVFRMAFPNAFRELVERSANRSKVDPNLLHAVVREESRFRPEVKSGAGAMGLVQLLPSTAALVARKAGIENFTEESLLQPHQNLILGSLYLRSLTQLFKGNLVRVVASYNAGPGSVLKWMELNPGLAADDFVEEIPFKETREYVKRVLGSYAAYSLLSESDAAPRLASNSLVPGLASHN
jgi:soluble lytic murein transglycosylase